MSRSSQECIEHVRHMYEEVYGPLPQTIEALRTAGERAYADSKIAAHDRSVKEQGESVFEQVCKYLAAMYVCSGQIKAYKGVSAREDCLEATRLYSHLSVAGEMFEGELWKSGERVESQQAAVAAEMVWQRG